MRPKLSLREISEFVDELCSDPAEMAAIDARINKDTATYNRSVAHMGLTHSQITKDKISAALKGRPVEIVTCPHCKKTGGNAAMRRWHFDACKFKSLGT